MNTFAAITIFLGFGLAQTGANKPPTHEEVSKIFNCAFAGCAIWDLDKPLDNNNIQIEFTQNHEKVTVFVSKSSREDRAGRIDFEIRHEEDSDDSKMESFGCSLDGNVPFKDSSMPFGFSGKRPDSLDPPFFKSPADPEYWLMRFNEAVADTLAFMSAHSK